MGKKTPKNRNKNPDGSRNWRYYYHKRKSEDPLKQRFFDKRTNAKKKGHLFNLTLDQFRELFKPYKNRLKTVDLDRIDPSEGYTLGNCQVIPRKKHYAKTAYERSAEGGGFVSDSLESDYLFGPE